MRVWATELIATTENTSARVELRRLDEFMRRSVCNLKAALLSDGLRLVLQAASAHAMDVQLWLCFYCCAPQCSASARKNSPGARMIPARHRSALDARGNEHCAR
jgi:hypothetical protein